MYYIQCGLIHPRKQIISITVKWFVAVSNKILNCLRTLQFLKVSLYQLYFYWACTYVSSINSGMKFFSFDVECTGNKFGENCSGTCECLAKNSVHPEQSCDRSNGACRCLGTWTGEKCDVDIDECQMNTHSCNVSEHLVCKNKPGGFDCICKDCFPTEPNATAGKSS